MEKINIAEILKNCPQGMELDCVMFDDVVFEEIDFSSSKHPVVIRKTDTNTTIYLTQYGQYIDGEGCKCIIFPQGKTTWEGFVPPHKYKNGDVVITALGNTAIIGGPAGNTEYYAHCVWVCDKLITDDIIDAIRFATESEKAELFKAIKENGCKWNEETKTLEELIEPTFKVGDRIRLKNGGSIIEVTSTNNDGSICVNNMSWTIKIKQQDNYELVPNKFDITTLKPFESRVLVREGKSDVWQPSYYGFLNQRNKRFYTTTNTWLMCIPYNEDTKHLIGTTNDCEEFYKTWEERT